jgi:hypothetical protein
MSKKPTAKSQTKFNAFRVLADSELDGVSGGTMLQSAFSNVIKSIGEGMAAVARKG